MATVKELSDPWSNFMSTPGSGPDYCATCTTFIGPAYTHCVPCHRNASSSWLAAVLPISYEVRGSQLHTSLAGYKRWHAPIAEPVGLQLAAVLWRFLETHERCLATATGVERFDVVTTVPSSDQARDETHPLRTLVGQVVQPTATRHERLLRRSTVPVESRTWDDRRYECIRALGGARVLLIDDTWTTGASAQTAAAALRRAGAQTVAAVVVGRFVNPGFQDNAARLKRHPPGAFTWDRCARQA